MQAQPKSPRYAHDYESVRIEFIPTGQRVGPYNVLYARQECGGVDYRFYDLNGEVCQ